MNIPTVAKEGQKLDDIRLELQNKIDDSYIRITHYERGYETQLHKLKFKWKKLSQNQQNLSNLTKQLKNVQSIWKLQLNVNLQVNQLFKLFGFNQINNHDKKKREKTSDQMYDICVKIINDIRNMSEVSNNCIVQMQMSQQKNTNKSTKTSISKPLLHTSNKSPLNDIMIQLHHEIKLYSNITVEIVKFAFNSIVSMNDLYITIKCINNLNNIFNSIYDIDIKPCISYIHSLFYNNIFSILFDSSSCLFQLQI
eukprot:263210_1